MIDPMCEEVLISLRKILRAISMQSRQLSSKCGITTPQLLVLKALNASGTMSVGALSQKVTLSQATVTAIIDRLEKRQLVQRERSSIDRRRVYVSLTEEGQVMQQQAPSPIQESFSRAFAGLEDWEQTLILSTLQRIAGMMNATDLPAAPLLVEDPQL